MPLLFVQQVGGIKASIVAQLPMYSVCVYVFNKSLIRLGFWYNLVYMCGLVVDVCEIVMYVCFDSEYVFRYTMLNVYFW